MGLHGRSAPVSLCLCTSPKKPVVKTKSMETRPRPGQASKGGLPAPEVIFNPLAGVLDQTHFPSRDLTGCLVPRPYQRNSGRFRKGQQDSFGRDVHLLQPGRIRHARNEILPRGPLTVTV
jgi:hypothetical protein